MSIYPTGTLIANRYEVIQGPAEKRSLKGGMGLVYLCLDRQEDRPVALKTFQPQFLPDRAARDRFLREGTTWVDLGRHPHIVRCYKVERVGDGREVYLALELVAQEPGRPDASLRAWLTPGQPLPVEQALLFALQIVRGMEHACATLPGFVHRDLKPENILVGADRLASLKINRLRVTDFGLANILSGSEVPSYDSDEPGTRDTLNRTQLTHGIVGTPLYMAPEQWTGGQVGTYTDVYALGCILFEMLTGQRVVDGRTLKALEQAHRAGQIQALPPTLPEAVRSLVRDCLQLVPEHRYPAWDTLVAALGETWQQVTGQEISPAEAPQALAREERLTAGWSYSHMGASYLDLGKADVARNYFKRAQAAGQAEGEPRLESTALGNLGLTYAVMGDTQQAIGFYEKDLAIRREIGDQRGEGAALGNLGNAYAKQSDNQRAIGFYGQALEILRTIGERQWEGHVLTGLGSAYAVLGDARRAIGFYEQGLAISRAIGNKSGEASALDNLGNVFADLGDIRRAIGYHEQSLNIHREIGNRRGEGTSLSNLGVSYADQGNIQQALSFFEQAINIRREIGDLNGIATDAFNMASLYIQENNPASALLFAKEATQIWSQIGGPHAQRAQQLVDQLLGGEASAPTQAELADTIQAAFEAFQQAGSAQEMQATVAQYPFMTDAKFIIPIEKVIIPQTPSKYQPAFRQRLTWLKQLANQKQPGLLFRLFGKKR